MTRFVRFWSPHLFHGPVDRCPRKRTQARWALKQVGGWSLLWSALAFSLWVCPRVAVEAEGGSAPPAAEGDTAEPQPRPSEEVALDRAWDEVARALKHGDYEQARSSLQAILALRPGDPRAALYLSLCERRLRAPLAFPQLSPSHLAALRARLEEEQRQQRLARARQRVIERQIRREQARWDEEVKALQRQAEQDAEARRRQARGALPARPQAKPTPAAPATAAVTRPVSAPPPVPTAPAKPAVTEALPRPSAPRAAAPPARSVELAPVVVPTTPGAPPGVSPSLVGRALPPPGAVSINARQMSMSPDQKIAVAEGDVEVVYGNAVLTCDRLTLFTDTKDAYAEGRVRIEEGAQVFRGEVVHYNFEAKKGRFLEGTASLPPWHEHGRSVEHIAEGVLEVSPGYLTSCELEPPHFRFFGSRAFVFAEDRIVRARNATIFSEEFPLIYLPWIAVADRQTPFFFIPGKRKPWEEFLLMGYRYKWPEDHKGTLRLDWRRAMGWGTGLDHRFETAAAGKGLLKVYYNEERYLRVKEDDLPKGASINRYRVLWRHLWKPLAGTTVVTDLQKFSDENFRKDLLFREEYTRDDVNESFLSLVKSTQDFALTGQVRKRMNRFQTMNELWPQVAVETSERPIGETPLYSNSRLDVANFTTKRRHSDNDTDVVRVDWFQQLSYALNLFRPVLMTPRFGVRQTYYTKDIQSGPDAAVGKEREQGRHDVISGQASMGLDASLKLFRLFPVTTDAFGLHINWLRHVLTPTVAYSYIRRPTVPAGLVTFSAAQGPTHAITFGLENKLQTKRPIEGSKKLRSTDLARFLLSIPYTFRGNHNKPGGRLGDWACDLELYPWPWLRLESDLTIPSHFVRGTRDRRITTWNADLIMVGGRGEPEAQEASDIQAPERRYFEPGPKGGVRRFIPQGQWYVGLGHRYAQNDKTEDVLQFDWGLSDKWEIGTFHRFTWKEVAGGAKRFANMREWQYSLRRDLHDWVAELIYRVDREFGEELYFTMTLKAYPELPIEIGESYHQPKIGSQHSPFSPVGKE